MRSSEHAISHPEGVRERLPSGTVTFAFTDIEGSTQRWERDPAAMEDAVRRHDRLVRTALTEDAGHVRKRRCAISASTGSKISPARNACPSCSGPIFPPSSPRCVRSMLRERIAPDDLARQLAEGAGLTPEAAVALALEEP